MNIRAIFSALLFMPAMAFAHVLSITATTPFPSEVGVTSTTTATFQITNISPATITAVDKSDYPAGSGLSTSASTCGAALLPNQSCTMQVTLQASSQTQTISSALKVWAKPTIDGVQSPFVIKITAGLPQITLVPVAVNSQLPALRDPVVATYNNEWLIVSGTTGNFHQFENTYFINSIYVYNPATQQIYSMLVSSTNLPAAVKAQLASSNTEFYVDGDTLYIIGGFNTANNISFLTLSTITSINVPGMLNAVKAGNTNLAAFVNSITGASQF